MIPSDNGSVAVKPMLTQCIAKNAVFQEKYHITFCNQIIHSVS